MKTSKTISGARRFARQARGPLVLVPTMGALHAGHAALLRAARKIAGRGGAVAVSLFVNPIQFDAREDLAGYPRREREDRALCRRENVDFLFAPTPGEMYAPDRSVTVCEGALSAGLCGASRPGHFDGVCTVVAKLFNIIEPDIAVFGEKDYQQIAVVRRMVRDLDFDIGIVAVPTVREPDGLALSSRNARLTPEERRVAPGIYAALRWGADRAGLAAARIEAGVRDRLAALPGARVDYVRVVDAETLEPGPSPARCRVLAAALFLGKTRLIDNIALPGADGRQEG